MKVIKDSNIFQSDFVIKKSRFITFIKKIKSKSELSGFIEECFDKKARHNCYSFSYIDSSQVIKGYSNDGEPSGTSGDAILNFININKLEGLCIFVVRHFGGVKLGTGPLKRSYLKGAIGLINNDIEFEENYLFHVSFKTEIKNQSKIYAFLTKNKNFLIERKFDISCVWFNIKSNEKIFLEEIAQLIIE